MPISAMLTVAPRKARDEKLRERIKRLEDSGAESAKQSSTN